MGSYRAAGLAGPRRRHADETGKPARAGTPAIDVSHLAKDFGGRTAVSDVSFSLARGEVFGRPEELRDQLFARTLIVTTLAPLPDPGRTFAGLPAVNGWHVVASGSEDLVSAVILTLASAGLTAGEVQVESATLEDAFVRLTGRHLHGEGMVPRS